MISASDFAASPSKPPEVFFSRALLLWAGGLHFADFALLKQNRSCFSFEEQNYSKLMHSILCLEYLLFHNQCFFFLSITALSSFILPLIFLSHCESLEVTSGPQGTNAFSPFLFPSYPPSCPLYLCISPPLHTLPILAPLHSFNLETIASLTPQSVSGPVKH